MFSNDLSIDLGTANTLIYVRGQGIVLNEPSVVAVRQDRAFGRHPHRRRGRQRGQADARPHARQHHHDPADEGRRHRRLHLHRGNAQAFHPKVHKSRFLRPSPRVLVCVPCGSTQVERRAIKESALEAGARDVYLIEEPMAAAIGAGMPVHRGARLDGASTSAAAPPKWR